MRHKLFHKNSFTLMEHDFNENRFSLSWKSSLLETVLIWNYKIFLLSFIILKKYKWWNYIETDIFFCIKDKNNYKLGDKMLRD